MFLNCIIKQQQTTVGELITLLDLKISQKNSHV